MYSERSVRIAMRDQAAGMADPGVHSSRPLRLKSLAHCCAVCAEWSELYRSHVIVSHLIVSCTQSHATSLLGCLY